LQKVIFNFYQTELTLVEQYLFLVSHKLSLHFYSLNKLQESEEFLIQLIFEYISYFLQVL